MEWLSAADAASELGVSGRHVRRLAQAGLMPAERLGDVWLMSAAAVRERVRGIPSAGRPLSAPMAWAVLMVADAALRNPNEPPTRELLQRPLNEVLDRKARYRLRGLIVTAPPPDRWAHWLARRASSYRVWVHPGVLDRLVADARLRPAGGFAAAARGAGIAVGPARRFYVDEDDIEVIVAAYRARRDAEGEVELMVIPRAVPAALRPSFGEPVPLAAALADLLESADARERYLAIESLNFARAALRSVA
jgi:excisionase family DNA binding protein